jgi:(1->4)-alpha-D-glucan 1-alpha-D-glucosylmutase
MNAAYEQFTRQRDPFHEIAYRGKQIVLRVSMASELNVLGHQIDLLSERHRHYRDFTLNSLTQAMREIIACFPVYRTYVTEREPDISPRDRGYIEQAVHEAKRRNPNRPAAVYAFVGDLLLRRTGYVAGDADYDEQMRCIGKFQQVTSPITAKGIEDTALYIYHRLVSLNEVGGEPDHFGTSPDAVHAWLGERAQRWPHGLSTTSTHDTKRSEDVRARLNVLSELPGDWKQAAARWARLNRRARAVVDDEPYPIRNEEYLYYQTLLGTWPFEPMDAPALRDYIGRITTYMLKAMREAKVYSNWLNPSERHEQAMTRFVETTLSADNTAFREDFQPFLDRIAGLGIWNSLAHLVLKIAAPGVPDFYQGTESWDFSLVDPDNRRPVDYVRRRQLLADLDAATAGGDRAPLIASLLAHPSDDRLKLYVASTLLRFRRDRRDLFEQGGYTPLAVEGAAREHVFAFARSDGSKHLIVAIPRLVATLAPDGAPPVGERVWGDTRIRLDADAPATCRDALTGRETAAGRDGGATWLRAADVFAGLPVAVLEG